MLFEAKQNHTVRDKMVLSWLTRVLHLNLISKTRSVAI